MTRLQILLLALELSVFIWIGVFVAGRWIVEESDIEFEITSGLR